MGLSVQKVELLMVAAVSKGIVYLERQRDLGAQWAFPDRQIHLASDLELNKISL